MAIALEEAVPVADSQTLVDSSDLVVDRSKRTRGCVREYETKVWNAIQRLATNPRNYW